MDRLDAPKPPVLLSLADAADVANMSVQTLRSRIHDGKLRAFKLRGNKGPYVIVVSELIEFILRDEEEKKCRKRRSIPVPSAVERTRCLPAPRSLPKPKQ